MKKKNSLEFKTLKKESTYNKLEQLEKHSKTVVPDNKTHLLRKNPVKIKREQNLPANNQNILIKEKLYFARSKSISSKIKYCDVALKTEEENLDNILKILDDTIRQEKKLKEDLKKKCNYN